MTYISSLTAGDSHAVACLLPSAVCSAAKLMCVQTRKKFCFALLFFNSNMSNQLDMDIFCVILWRIVLKYCWEENYQLKLPDWPEKGSDTSNTSYGVNKSTLLCSEMRKTQARQLCSTSGDPKKHKSALCPSTGSLLLSDMSAWIALDLLT